jgi:hypothetical protein
MQLLSASVVYTASLTVEAIIIHPFTPRGSSKGWVENMREESFGFLRLATWVMVYSVEEHTSQYGLFGRSAVL